VTAGPAISALRQSTGELHQALEDGAAIEPRLKDLATRPAVVAAFHAFHAEVEEALKPWLIALTANGWAPSARTRAIARDLGRLAAEPLPVTVAPTPLSLGEALGWAYVAEGSTLGGRVILKGFASEKIDLRGLGFLDPFGATTGDRWRAFVELLESAVADGRARLEDVVRGANAAFAHARLRLSPISRVAEPVDA
jgi:heme oxygenase (biliverdin-IX-beta and delta-forming)